MKKLLIIVAFCGTVFAARAQLLEDNQNRLKTARKEARGLFRNKKNVKSKPEGSGRKVQRPISSPRYSSNLSSVFKRKAVLPRTSAGSPFKGKAFRVSPRYTYKRTRVSRASQPRYSFGNPFSARDFRVNTRYSLVSPFKPGVKVTPRYSFGSPFRARDFRVNTRYSLGSPFKPGIKVKPRYSIGSPWKVSDFKIRPRYSSGSPYRNKDYKVKAPNAARKNAPTLSAMHSISPASDWSAFWIKLMRNNKTSKVVNPKFDKKERVLWNN